MYWVVVVFILGSSTPLDVIKASTEGVCKEATADINRYGGFDAHCVLGGDM